MKVFGADFQNRHAIGKYGDLLPTRQSVFQIGMQRCLRGYADQSPGHMKLLLSTIVIVQQTFAPCFDYPIVLHTALPHALNSLEWLPLRHRWQVVAETFTVHTAYTGHALSAQSYIDVASIILAVSQMAPPFASLQKITFTVSPMTYMFWPMSAAVCTATPFQPSVPQLSTKRNHRNVGHRILTLVYHPLNDSRAFSQEFRLFFLSYLLQMHETLAPLKNSIEIKNPKKHTTEKRNAVKATQKSD